MGNLRFDLEYDGTRFAGWQRQAPPNEARTVQGELESALARILQEEVSVIGAGRTDAGVHARGQVANARIGREDIAPEELRRALRGVLPRDMVCARVSAVPDAFHARYDARKRMYSYTITHSPRAIGRFYAWEVGWKLDDAVLERAANAIVGAHDFTSFSKAHGAAKHHRCTVASSRWSRNGSERRFEIAADRFVYSMVRALVGAMVAAARGKITVEEFRAILEACDRRRNTNPLAPPHGLCLEEIQYNIVNG